MNTDLPLNAYIAYSLVITVVGGTIAYVIGHFVVKALENVKGKIKLPIYLISPSTLIVGIPLIIFLDEVGLIIFVAINLLILVGIFIRYGRNL